MDKTLMGNPNYAAAIDFIKTHDLTKMEKGKHIIDGKNLYVMIVDTELRPKEQARLEAHDMYIDVQVPLSVEESFGIKPRKDCKFPDGEMDPENDIMFFNDEITETITAQPGDIITFAPDMAHAPLIGQGTTHKAIFKVKVA